ncbi:MAG: 30S ribosomal protein S4 [Alphaproteobacteria bacterium]|nr:30S ribosomal protein S4 [Alphaproteobacteria bacterium]
MTKRIQAKYKIDRRLGMNLWGRPKSPFNKRQEKGPGQHGARRGKPSGYRIQLMAKQQLKGYYGVITEKQFRRAYAEALRLKGDTGENLVGLLERRLDAVVYRAKFVNTIFAARQFISHGHIRVNGQKVDIPSYQLRVGDMVSVSSISREMPLVMESVSSEERHLPEYLDVDNNSLQARFVRVPTLGEIPYPTKMEPSLVVEFYSR